jgi:two-component system invasion response regulator UvrY
MSTAATKRILIADDHSVVRFGLQLLIKEIAETQCSIDFAKDGSEVLRLSRGNTYDILILDINMPNSDSLNLVSQIIAIQPEIKILILSVNPEKVYAKRYLEAGAYGYVQKEAPDEELRNAFVHVFKGLHYFSHNQMLHFSETLLGKNKPNPFDRLSAREFSAAMLFLEGQSITEVAQAMHISPSTTSTHKSRIYGKLQIDNLIELQKLAKLHKVLEERE